MTNDKRKEVERCDHCMNAPQARVRYREEYLKSNPGVPRRVVAQACTEHEANSRFQEVIRITPAAVFERRDAQGAWRAWDEV